MVFIPFPIIRRRKHKERRWNGKVHNTDVVHPGGEEPIGNFFKGQDEGKSLLGMKLAIFALEREREKERNFWGEERKKCLAGSEEKRL